MENSKTSLLEILVVPDIEVCQVNMLALVIFTYILS